MAAGSNNSSTITKPTDVYSDYRVNFGYFEYKDSGGTIKYRGNTADGNVDLNCLKCSEMKLVNTASNPEGEQLDWWACIIDGKLSFISRTLYFNNISVNQAKAFCNSNSSYYINGEEYEFTILTRMQWGVLQYPTIRAIFTYYENHYPNIIVDSFDANGRYYTVSYFEGGDVDTHARDPVDPNATNAGCQYVPVLIPKGKKIRHKMGTLKVGKRYYHSQYRGMHITPGMISEEGDGAFTFEDTNIDCNKWEWLEFTHEGRKKYICVTPIDTAIYWADVRYFYDQNITLNNERYHLRLPTTSEIVAIRDAGLLSNIDNEDQFRSNRCPVATSTMSNNRYTYVEYDSRRFGSAIAPNAISLKFREGSSDYDYDMYTIPILITDNNPPTISGSDSNLGNKTRPFSVTFTVNDTDPSDTLSISCILNGTTYKNISNAVRNQEYTFEINSSMFSNLGINSTNTIKITVSDGKTSTTRTYTFTKTNTAPVINYTGSLNLGSLTSKPTIRYTVTDAENDSITITERLNGKTLRTYTVNSGTACTVNISDSNWLSCSNGTNTVEISVRDTVGGTSNKTITFTRGIDRIEIITDPIVTNEAVTKVLLDVDWDTTGATGSVYVSNNAFDSSPTWENMTSSLKSNYNITNRSKTSSNWGLSIKVIIKKNEGYTGEVSLYCIKGTYE